MSSAKRMKLTHTVGTVKELEPSATINNLPSEVLKNIFSYVGKGNYCLIGPVSKDFCFNYLTMDVIEDEFAHRMDYLQAIDRNKFTSSDVAASCPKLAEECFLDGPDTLNEEICMIAALEGRKDIVTMGVTFGVDLAQRIDKEILGEIAAKGDLEMLQLLLGTSPFDCCHPITISHIIENSARHGHIHILKWLFNDNSNRNRRDTAREESASMFKAAAESGNLDIIEWGKDIMMLESYNHCKHWSFYNALKGGHISLVRWFRGQGLPFDEHTLPGAAKSRNIALLEYLLQYECPNVNPVTCASVFSSESDEYKESLHLLKWLREQHNAPWNEETCCRAAESGNIDALKWARESGCPWNEGTLCAAVKMGHFGIVDYCLENRCPFANGHAYIVALDNLNIPDALKMIKLLWKFEVPLNDQVCAAAAGNAHIEALKWLRSLGCAWDEDAFYNALQSCDVPTIQYCIDNNCPVNDDERLYACAVCCEEPIEMLEILKKHDYKSWTAATSTLASTENNIRVLQWLRHNGCLWNEHVCHEAVRNDNIKILKYAHENGCPWTKETYAYCWDRVEGIEYEFREIPGLGLGLEPICSDVILNYLHINKCPKPHPHEWRLRRSRSLRFQIGGD